MKYNKFSIAPTVVFTTFLGRLVQSLEIEIFERILRFIKLATASIFIIISVFCGFFAFATIFLWKNGMRVPLDISFEMEITMFLVSAILFFLGMRLLCKNGPIVK